MFSRLLSNGTERRVGIGKRRGRLGAILKDLKNEVAVEGKADAKLSLVLAERFLVPADEDWAVLYNRMDIVRREIFHGDLLTVNTTHVPESTSVR